MPAPCPGRTFANGRLNQTAYSLFLFVRDLATATWLAGSTTDWKARKVRPGPSWEAARQEALIGPLRNVYGVSDKILIDDLSTLLIGAREHRPVWRENRYRDDRGRHAGFTTSCIARVFYRTAVVLTLTALRVMAQVAALKSLEAWQTVSIRAL